ncbi:MAG: ABC transporter ATP-binding protein [Chitinispirillales bacterium]|jgi:oligopeptide/dipeptide ABC transporter ATP-binding protein|nr:ABC transporter ATP-binding protein [Chitinispirillales bacterium]
MSLLEIKNLAVDFELKKTTVHAVRNVSLSIEKGETHCVVGESGCGKSVSSYAIMNLIEKPGKITNGEIIFNGQNLLKIDKEKMRKIRAKEISMIFQDPMNSLNPVYRCGDQIAEVLVAHKGINKKDALAEAVRVLDSVKVTSPQKRIMQYPHELSGGLRQRIMIAMAIICKPMLLIADEPTTALDVTVQRQILDILNDLRKEMKMAVLFITHDLGIVNVIADKISVLYAGEVVESGCRNEIFDYPKHHYTIGLLNAVAKIGGKKEKLKPIEGNLPDASNEIKGCAFETRCPKRLESCKNKKPPETKIKEHKFYCFNPFS